MPTVFKNNRYFFVCFGEGKIFHKVFIIRCHFIIFSVKEKNGCVFELGKIVARCLGGDRKPRKDRF